MFSELHKRVKKVGKPPGSALYTGEAEKKPPVITTIIYSAHDYHEATTSTFVPPPKHTKGVTWINVEGLHDVELVKELAKHFDLHPLTVEDILNVEQRPKVEEFENYLFITVKVILHSRRAATFNMKQISFILGHGYVLTFQELDTTLFDTVKTRLKSSANQALRKHGSDYLTYRLLDTIVDEYFVVLEWMGEQIEQNEESIIFSPTQQNARVIYRLKRQMLMLRKSIWPMREAINHLIHADNKLIGSFTSIYFRDIYDHMVQAIDTLETFRDMLSSMLDMYLSSLTNRMNEIMKTLTIITTIFIPITALASIYGMNFTFMPGLNSRSGYYVILGLMGLIAILMILYFRRKKWI